VQAEALMPVVPLENMSTGEEGRVYSLEGSAELVVRLQEMGLREGAAVRMVRAGSPCILAVNNQRLSLRFDGNATVLVELTQ
jgi:ferrous iron transport protein A